MSEVCSLKKSNKNDKLLVRLRNEKKPLTSVINIRNGKGTIATEPADITKYYKRFYGQLYINIFEILD